MTTGGGAGFFLTCEDFGRMVNNSFPTYASSSPYQNCSQQPPAEKTDRGLCFMSSRRHIRSLEETEHIYSWGFNVHSNLLRLIRDLRLNRTKLIIHLHLYCKTLVSFSWNNCEQLKFIKKKKKQFGRPARGVVFLVILLG